MNVLTSGERLVFKEVMIVEKGIEGFTSRPSVGTVGVVSGAVALGLERERFVVLWQQEPGGRGLFRLLGNGLYGRHSSVRSFGF